MKYDDASSHLDSGTGETLPAGAGATHIGMFLAWAILRGFAGPLQLEDLADQMERLKRREITPGAYLLQAGDGQFSEEDLSDEGNAFAQDYYENNERGYVDDYMEILSPDPESSLYLVPDTWETFDILCPRLDQRYAEWKSQQG